jgi:hypothetical protein
LRSAALYVRCGTLAVDKARIGTRLDREHVGAKHEAEQFWIIASLD